MRQARRLGTPVSQQALVEMLLSVYNIILIRANMAFIKVVCPINNEVIVVGSIVTKDMAPSKLLVAAPARSICSCLVRRISQ